MADLCDVYTRARLLIRLSDNNLTAASRLLDCAPLFESETSVCTLVPANPEYYAGGSTAGKRKVVAQRSELSARQNRRLERDGEVFTKEKRFANSRAKRNTCALRTFVLDKIQS